MALVQIARRLAKEAGDLSFGAPVAYVYNPLEYAAGPHEAYLKRFGTGRKEVLLLGMNPGPFGMAQTGVPFGEIDAVLRWLRIDGEVGRPPREHPKRPIQGFACGRREVSGQRLWGWARTHYRTPRAFFARYFVANYCPLLFLTADGRNITPDRLAIGDRRALLEVCDRALADTVDTLAPRAVVGIGKWAERRVREVLGFVEVRVGGVLHPSPASPAANRGWEQEFERGLRELGISP